MANPRPGGTAFKLIAEMLDLDPEDVWAAVTKKVSGGQAGKEGFTASDERDGLIFSLLSRGVSAVERQADALESIATVLNKREERRAAKN